MPRQVRIFAGWRSSRRRLFQLSTVGDGSLFLFPYGPGDTYYAGTHTFGHGQVEKTFTYTLGGPIRDRPKPSLHTSGTVHVKCGDDYVAGPLRAIPFRDLRGDHIASFSADALAGQPVFEDVLRNGRKRQDHVLELRDELENLRVAIYANAAQATFHGDVNLIWQVEARGIKLHVGLGFYEEEVLDEAGASVIAGWDAAAGNLDATDFLYVRGV